MSRAYLRNFDIFESFQFGVGDTIRVYKANMIIPQITDNETKSGTYRMLYTCPCCGELLSVIRTTGGTRQLHCENPHYAAKLVQKFTHFCEKVHISMEFL